MGVRVTCLDPNEQSVPYLEVVTLRAGAHQKGVLTCEQLYEVFTHFIAGRTLPCMEQGCAACAAHRPARYEAFASVVWLHNRQHQIVRMTKNAVMMLKTAIPSLTSLRGYGIEIQRKSSRANGRLSVMVAEQIVPSNKLPEAPVLAQHLSRIWRIDGLEVDVDDRAYVAQYEAFVADTEAAKGVKNAS